MSVWWCLIFKKIKDERKESSPSWILHCLRSDPHDSWVWFFWRNYYITLFLFSALSSFRWLLNFWLNSKPRWTLTWLDWRTDWLPEWKKLIWFVDWIFLNLLFSVVIFAPLYSVDLILLLHGGGSDDGMEC